MTLLIASFKIIIKLFDYENKSIGRSFNYLLIAPTAIHDFFLIRSIDRNNLIARPISGICSCKTYFIESLNKKLKIFFLNTIYSKLFHTKKKKEASLGAGISQLSQKKSNATSSNLLEFSTHLQGDLSEGWNFLSLRLRVPAGIEGPGRAGHG